jgi:diguanylate cyclase (GGDEF)-like protein
VLTCAEKYNVKRLAETASVPVTVPENTVPEKRHFAHVLYAYRFWLLGVALGLTTAVGLYLVFLPNGGAVGNDVDNVTETVAAGLACLAGAIAAQAGRLTRRWAWAAMASGAFAWSVGQLLVTLYQWHGGAQPLPGLPDVGFLLFPPGCFVCLVFLKRSAGSGGGFRREFLDGSIISVAFLVAAWASPVGRALTSHQGSTHAAAMAAAYTLTDVAVCAMALLLLSQASTLRPVAALIGIGLAGLAISDTAYTYFVTLKRYSPWQWVDTFWTGGFLLLAVAAVFGSGLPREGKRQTRRRPGRLKPEVTTSTWQMLLPYVPAGFAFAALLGRYSARGQLDAVSVVGAMVLVGLVLARQFVALNEVRRLTAEVRHRASHDPLTGLANRSLFQDRLEHAVSAYKSELRPCSVLFIDLDGFKLINDEFGHAVGDQVLAEVAARLRACTSPVDTVARLGGDEFAVLVEGNMVDPLDVAAALQRALRPPFRSGGLALRFRASIGVARADSSTDPHGTELLRRADIALYAAKAAGKGTVREHDKSRSDTPLRHGSPFVVTAPSGWCANK